VGVGRGAVVAVPGFTSQSPVGVRYAFLVFGSLVGTWIEVPCMAAGLDNFFLEELGGRLV